MLSKLLTTPSEQLGRAGRFAAFQIKLWSHCARLLKKNRAGQQAAALSYHTIFGIVPLAIVTLLIFQAFPASSNIADKVKGFAYDQLNLSNIEYSVSDAQDGEKGMVLTEYLDDIVEKFFTGVHKGTITILSCVVVIWAAIGLLSTIERAFNNIWHVTRPRSFIHRIINYWALLTLGPLLLGLGIFITTQYSAIGRLQETVLSNVTPWILSYLVAMVAFFLLYFILPNTRVTAGAAVWGAIVAALVWTLVKNLFGLYVTQSKPYSTVYGVMAMIPLMVLWIHLTWLIVLFGLQLTFTTQHLHSLDAADIAAANKSEEFFIANDLTVINIVKEIAAAFESNNAPVEAEVISSKLSIPPEFMEKILDRLVVSRIVSKTAEPKIGFIPAKEPANIKLSEIADAVAQAGFAQSTIDSSESFKRLAKSQQAILSQCNIKEILDIV